MKRENGILLPCLIIGELFTIYASYVLNGVWSSDENIVEILNRFNIAIKNPNAIYNLPIPTNEVDFGNIKK